MDPRLADISLVGRTFYAIMCFERYVLKKYPDRDWSRVVDEMWKLCDDSYQYYDESAYRYSEMIQDGLHQLDRYQKLDCTYLSEEDFFYYRSILPTPEEDPKLTDIMIRIYDIDTAYIYAGIEPHAPDSLPYIEDIERILEEEGIEKPNVDLLIDFTVDQEKAAKVSDEWGGFDCDGRYLSIILNRPKKSADPG